MDVAKGRIVPGGPYPNLVLGGMCQGGHICFQCGQGPTIETSAQIGLSQGKPTSKKYTLRCKACEAELWLETDSDNIVQSRGVTHDGNGGNTMLNFPAITASGIAMTPEMIGASGTMPSSWATTFAQPPIQQPTPPIITPTIVKAITEKPTRVRRSVVI